MGQLEVSSIFLGGGKHRKEGTMEFVYICGWSDGKYPNKRKEVNL